MEAPAGISRRDLLLATGAGALVAATPRVARAAIADVVKGGLSPELITVTDRGMAAWWATPTATDTVLRIARADGSGRRELRLERKQTVHVAAVDDLEPGTKYRYELVSGGKTMKRDGHNPGVFTTLDPPPGRRYARIAVLNDMHVGEHCSGTITTVNGESFPPCFSGDDYAYRMTTAAIKAIKRDHDVDFVIGNGDLTDRGRADDMKRCLDLFRGLKTPWQVTRGNHDRRDPGQPGCGADNDCMRAQAFPGQPEWDHALRWRVRIGDRLAIIGLDSVDPDTGDGRLDMSHQLDFMDAALKTFTNEGRVIMVVFHHHVTDQANATHPPPLFFGVRADRGAQDFLARIAKFDNVRLVMHGHTHRNYVSYDPLSGPRLPFVENGAVKEYPAGFAIVDIHEGGTMRTFHRMTDPFCRDWVRTSAQQVFGRQPAYTRGTLASRAFVHRVDCPVPDPGPSVIGPIGVPTHAVADAVCTVLGS